MARIDQVEPLSGTFRGTLAAAWTADDGVPVAVGLDVNGRVVPGAGTSGIAGIVVIVGAHNKVAGARVDVITAGELLEMSNDDMTGRAAGIPVYAVPADGLLTNVATANIKIGHTVENDRLVIRKGASAGTGA
jgi:hypothetical protein